MSTNVTPSLDTATPTPASVEKQVAATASASNVIGEAGFQSSSIPGADSRVMVDNSVVSGAKETSNISALTQYTDVKEVDTAVVPWKQVPIADPAFTFPRGYFEVCERSVWLGSFQVNFEDPTAVPYVRLDVANCLLQYPFIRDKLSYPVNIRYNMEVQLRVLATNFHYGQLMVVWRPAFMPYIVGSKDERTFQQVCEMTDNEWGTFDTVWTASQLPHKILSVTAGNSITIELPWGLNKQYVPALWMMSTAYHPGFLDIYKLTPIAPTDADQAVIQVYARFKDIVGFGYRAVTSESSENSTPKTWKYISLSTSHWTFTPFDDKIVYGPNIVDGGKISWGNFGVNSGTTRTTPAHFQHAGKHGTILDWDTTPKFVPTAETEELQGYEVPDVTGGPLTQSWNTVMRRVNTIGSFIGRGLAFFGLSKPPIADIPQRFIEVAPPLGSSVGPDFTVSTGLNPASLVNNAPSDHDERTLIEKLGSTWMFLYWGKLSLNVVRLWVGPSLVMKAPVASRDAIVMSPATYVANRFRYWRGDLVYKIIFSTSSFVATRARISIHYLTPEQQLTVGLVPTQVVEVKGDTIVEGRAPFMLPQYWGKTSTYAVWAIDIVQQDTFVKYDASTSATPFFTVWYAFEGFQVACPYTAHPLGVYWATQNVDLEIVSTSYKAARDVRVADDPYPLESEEIQGDTELPGVTDTSSVTNVGMNDIPTSVYHIAKRYSGARGFSVSPFAPLPLLAAYDTTQLKPYELITYHPLSQAFNVLFRWARGSVCVVSNQLQSTCDVYNQANGAVYLYGRKGFMDDATQTWYESSAPFLSSWGGRLIAHRQPYRNQNAYLSAPHMVVQHNISGMAQAYSLGQFLGEDTPQVLFHPSVELGAVDFAWSFGDDLCLNGFMGVPVHFALQDGSLREALYKMDKKPPGKIVSSWIPTEPQGAVPSKRKFRRRLFRQTVSGKVDLGWAPESPISASSEGKLEVNPKRPPARLLRGKS